MIEIIGKAENDFINAVLEKKFSRSLEDFEFQQAWIFVRCWVP